MRHNLLSIAFQSRFLGVGPVNELSRRVAGKACIVASVFFCLTACAVVDQYSGRAVVYNLQAEQAQEQALLLNVVRASLRRPMQFTGLQSITGTAWNTCDQRFD